VHKRNNRLSNRMTYLLIITFSPSPISSQIPHTLFDIISRSPMQLNIMPRTHVRQSHCAHSKMPQHNIVNCVESSYFPLPSRHSVLFIRSVRTSSLLRLGHCISLITDDPRETFFLFQRLSVANQRINAVCFANSFGNIDVKVRRRQPRQT